MCNSDPPWKASCVTAKIRLWFLAKWFFERHIEKETYMFENMIFGLRNAFFLFGFILWQIEVKDLVTLIFIPACPLFWCCMDSNRLSYRERIWPCGKSLEEMRHFFPVCSRIIFQIEIWFCDKFVVILSDCALIKRGRGPSRILWTLGAKCSFYGMCCFFPFEIQNCVKVCFSTERQLFFISRIKEEQLMWTVSCK